MSVTTCPRCGGTGVVRAPGDRVCGLPYPTRCPLCRGTGLAREVTR